MARPLVLAVDDEIDFLNLEKMCLEKHGIDIVTTTSASSALDFLEKDAYDVVVSDYQMPDVSGIELLKTIRTRGLDLGFIIFTGRGREDVVIEALNEGADYYIQKGTDSASQFTHLASLIESFCLAQESSKSLVESERLLRIANKRLDLLGQITRHDIGNDVMVINTYIALSQQEPDPAVARAHLSKAQSSAEKIAKTIELVRLYQINGALNIKWVPLAQTMERVVAAVSTTTAKIDYDVGEWWILVDPMLELVCSNIISNSIDHGGDVTKVDIRSCEESDGLDLIIEDDGVGVPDGEKEQIFDRLTPIGAPHGLTISRRILNAEGISIKETGIHGKGAKFVMHFPPGSYRSRPPHGLENGLHEDKH